LIGGGGGSALRGIGGAAGGGGGGATGACGALVGAVAQPASSAANIIAIAAERIVARRALARIGMCMEAMIGPDSSGVDGVEF
jgi:hypothetical protein